MVRDPGNSGGAGAQPGRAGLYPFRDGELCLFPEGAALCASPAEGRERTSGGARDLDRHRLLDRLGLYTTESDVRTREEVIRRQQQELLELSTPVVELWDGILALPLIGTLDSARTQIVMESLLERIVTSGAEIAIIDITGVPTVDTLVAQHLIKTISAARLMGADCILSGIRPQIAQTIVHLGLELSVISKATMASALALALRRTARLSSIGRNPPPHLRIAVWLRSPS